MWHFYRAIKEERSVFNVSITERQGHWTCCEEKEDLL
jgi:hypothetical protein